MAPVVSLGYKRIGPIPSDRDFPGSLRGPALDGSKMGDSETGVLGEAAIEMTSFRPRLLEAGTAGARMDALCEFMEFWLGPRRSSFGELARVLEERPLPMPLKRLYEFAGRWPRGGGLE